MIATDGGWVRNFPLEHAYRNPSVTAIVAFRYVASYRPTDVAFLNRVRDRLDRFRAVPPVRALLAEVRLAEERAARGEPAHYGEMIVRLMRVAIARNTVLEERLAGERETSVAELRTSCARTSCRERVAAAPPWRRRRLRGRARGALRLRALPVPTRSARPAADRPWKPGRERPRSHVPKRRSLADERAQARPRSKRGVPADGRGAARRRQSAACCEVRSAGARAGGRTPSRCDQAPACAEA